MILIWCFFWCTFSFATPFKAAGRQALPVAKSKILESVGIEEHLGQQLPVYDLQFVDELGHMQRLSKYFSTGKPAILVMVYFKCPHLCNYLFNGLMKGLKQLEYTVGKDFEFLMVSIDPREDYLLASQKKENIIKEYARSTEGWHILTGSQAMITTLAEAVGFHYRYDAQEDQYAHSAAIFVLTPSGLISRYLYGVEFKPSDLKMGLLEASRGTIGTTMDRFLLYCFHYDPSLRTYSLIIHRVVQGLCAVTVISLVGMICFFIARQKKEQIV